MKHNIYLKCWFNVLDYDKEFKEACYKHFPKSVLVNEYDEDCIGFQFFVISPNNITYYKIAQLVESNIYDIYDTLLVIYNKDNGKEFTEDERLQINEIKNIVEAMGARVFNTINDACEYMAKELKES
jgi:hypothetical protein